RHGFVPYSRIVGVRRECEHQQGFSYGDASEPTLDIWRVFLDLAGGEALELMKTGYSTSTRSLERPEDQDEQGGELVRAIEDARAAWGLAQRSADATIPARVGGP